MTYFPQDMDEDRKAREEAIDEFLDIAEEEQIAEGDISVSETEVGHDALPEVDDEDLDDTVLGEENLVVLDEDAPELGMSHDAVDHYLADDDDEDEDDLDGLDDDEAYQ